MAAYTSAPDKASAVERIYTLAGVEPEPLGPGSKEKISALVALAKSLSLDVSALSGKARIGESIAQYLGVKWDAACHSIGDTITLVGLNRLLDAAVQMRMEASGAVEDRLLQEVLNLVDELGPPAGTSDEEGSDDLAVRIEEVENDIAESIAVLSTLEQVPTTFDRAPVGVDAGAIRFSDGSWRDALLGVEEWLGLAAPLDSSSPEAFDASLKSSLLVNQPHVTLGTLDRLTFLEFLSARLERANTFAQDFQTELEAAVEGRADVDVASANWTQSWEDPGNGDGDEDDHAAPIHAQSKTLPIVQFVQYAVDGALEASPSYQRADVWPTGDAQLLIESVLRGIPLPSVILLEIELGDDIAYEVVDGKQRLTSILRFIGQHPQARQAVSAKAAEWGEPDLLEIFDGDYRRFKRLWKRHERTSLTASVEREHYFPFPLRGAVAINSQAR